MISLVGQVNRLSLYNKLCTFYKSHDVRAKVLYPLKNRGLVKVSGAEATPFLQGLITNDMDRFEEGTKSMYAMFLNNKGKVLYDTFIHKWGGETDYTFMLECDKTIQHLLEQHLEMHNLNKNVKVKDVSEQYKFWAFIASSDIDKALCESITEPEIYVYEDPRLADLGHRLITTPKMGQLNIRQAVGQDTVIDVDEQYVLRRYKLGVSEGASDIFPGTCCPLELNGDYLHGVSLNKIYFIGQEIINACIEQTGVRERIMPINFLRSNSEEEELFETDEKIWANMENGQTCVGKLKNHRGCFGLGLLRVKEALEAKTLQIGSCPIVVTQPDWWPIETMTEK